MPPPAGRPARVFCDADVIIAGAASTIGASHIILRLSELTLIDCLTSRCVLVEAERNLALKLPAALPAFHLIVDSAIDVVPEGSSADTATVVGKAHAKDVPVLAAAVGAEADFLATCNTRHFRSRSTPPLILRPGMVVKRVRRSLAQLLTGGIEE